MELNTNKNKYILFGIIGLIAAFVLVKYFYSQPKLMAGEMAPNFRIALNNGEEVSLDQLRGKYVLIDFWGSWCVPCRKDNPKLVQLYDQFHGQQFDKANDFEIVSISLEKEKGEWEKAKLTDGLDWKYQFADLNYMDSETAKLYEVKAVPTKFLLNEKGIIVGIDQRVDEIADFLQKRVQKD